MFTKFSILIFIHHLLLSEDANPSASSSSSSPPPPPLPTTEFVKQLNEDSLKDIEKKETLDFWFVIFYRDGGANCIRFMPAFNTLSTTLKNITNLKFGRVDCPNAGDTCLDIKGVPSVRLYHKGYFVEYDANRRSNSVDVISAWITETIANDGAKVKDGTRAVRLPPAPPGNGPLPTTENIRTFTDLDSFRIVKSAESTDFWFISLYRDSCPHCRQWIPTFNQVSLTLKDTPHLKFGRVDCINASAICDDINVRGVPTIKIFYKGSQRHYDDARDPETAAEWLLKVMENDGELVKNPPKPPPPKPLPTTEHIRAFTDVDSLHAVQAATTEEFWFITYYRDTCPHCRRWIPTFNDLSVKLKDTYPRLKFGRVDCSSPGEICAKEGARFLPSIRLFYKGFRKDYDNTTRDFEVVSAWLRTMLENDGALVKVQPPPPPPESPPLPKSEHVEQLDTVWLFKPALEKAAGSFVVINYYSEKTPKSQEFNPTFNSVADGLWSTPNLLFGRVNCPKGYKVCDEQAIPKLPTTRLYYKESVLTYDGGNDQTSLTTWIKDAIANGGVLKKEKPGEL